MVSDSVVEILRLDAKGIILLIFVIILFSLLPSGAPLTALYNNIDISGGTGFPFAWGYIVADCSIPLICGVGGRAIDILSIALDLFLWYIGTFMIIMSFDEVKKVVRW